MKRVLSLSAIGVTSVVIGLTSAGTAYAANPPGSGQPSQSCGSSSAPNSPAGFNSGGFAHAETVYAGSDGTPSAMNAHSASAVSQYDVACFQVSQR